MTGRRVAVVGGGIAGVAAAYQLHRLGIPFVLFEKNSRLGGIVETVRERGFVMECGPDGWVTAKPWASEVAIELGLAEELIESNDADRVTWVLQQGKLNAIPDNMRMMVPEDLASIADSSLFSPAAQEAYRREPERTEELKAAAPTKDESVASFIQRHFGEEVLRVLGAPLLGGVFGGDVYKLSVQSVMPAFVTMEREHGSLIRALGEAKKQRGGKPPAPVFTSLRSGTATLIEGMAAILPAENLRMACEVSIIARGGEQWLVNGEPFDHLMLAAPAAHAARLLQTVEPGASVLMRQPASSAVIVGFSFTDSETLSLPKGFGFLSPEGEDCRLMAATFSHQKFPHRVPGGGAALRAFFGGEEAIAMRARSDGEVAQAARFELEKVLGALPEPAVTVVRHWPDSLPQYEVGHGERMAELQTRVDHIGNLHLLGNGYRGVGLPDLIRDSRAAARSIADS